MPGKETDAKIDKGIALVVENKVSTKNAFDVELIEHIDVLLDDFTEAGEDFHRAAGAVAASARVYGYRVDSVYTDANKFSTSWIEGKFSETPDEFADRRAAAMAPGAAGAHLKPASMVTMSERECLATLDALDPYYCHMQRQIESGGDSALLLNLLPHNHRGNVVFNGQEKLHDPLRPKWAELMAKSPHAVGAPSLPQLSGSLCPHLDALVKQAVKAEKSDELANLAAFQPVEVERSAFRSADSPGRGPRPSPPAWEDDPDDLFSLTEAATFAELRKGGLAALAPADSEPAAQAVELSLEDFLNDVVPDEEFNFVKADKAPSPAAKRAGFFEAGPRKGLFEAFHAHLEKEEGRQNKLRATAAKKMLAAQHAAADKLTAQRQEFFGALKKKNPATKAPVEEAEAPDSDDEPLSKVREKAREARLGFFDRQQKGSAASQLLELAAFGGDSDFDVVDDPAERERQAEKREAELEEQRQQDQLAQKEADETQARLAELQPALFSGYKNARASTLRVPQVVQLMEGSLASNPDLQRVKFSDLLTHVKGGLRAEERPQLGVAIGFVCMLHLAAEKNCELIPGPGGGDFHVVPGKNLTAFPVQRKRARSTSPTKQAPALADATPAKSRTAFFATPAKAQNVEPETAEKVPKRAEKAGPPAKVARTAGPTPRPALAAAR